MKLGIGVSTYNRKESLVRTLEAVRRHTKSNYEIVVSDDGSRDGTQGCSVLWLGARRPSLSAGYVA
jgi:glycosyltransferase involved in cell wall biosynthesis